MTDRLAERHLLVTGATGKIGSVLVPQMVRDWPRVTALGRTQGRSPVIEELVRSGRLEFVRWDMTQATPPVEHQETLRRVTDLVHGAAIVDEPAPYGPEAVAMVRVNVLGAINLLRHLPNLRSVCDLSSVAVYGPPQALPCPETHPTEPTRLYGVTKLAVEHLCRLHARRAGLALAILRLSSVYGFPDDGLASTSAMATFLKRCDGGRPIGLVRTGELLRDYVHVTDVVDAIKAAVLRRADGTYNIASGQGHSLLEIAQQAGRIVGRVPEILIHPEWDPDADFTTPITYDISRARSQFGFQPTVRLFEAMQSMYEAHDHARG